MGRMGGDELGRVPWVVACGWVVSYFHGGGGVKPSKVYSYMERGVGS